MDCSNVLELLSDLVDRRLDPRAKEQIETHFARCTSCRIEYELATLSKSAVVRSLSRATTPLELAQSLHTQFTRASMTQTRGALFDRLAIRRRFVPALALGFAAIAAWMLFSSLPILSRHSHSSPQDNDIIHQTLNNFDAVLDGSVVLTVSSDDHAIVQSGLSNEGRCDVEVPRLLDCKLLGGMLSQCGGEPAAHIVYKRGNDLIYMYQVDLQKALTGGPFTLPANVKDELLRTGRYLLAEHPRCTLALWVSGNKLFAVVADIDKDELMGALAYAE